MRAVADRGLTDKTSSKIIQPLSLAGKKPLQISLVLLNNFKNASNLGGCNCEGLGYKK